jgi:hypothetical protein
MRRARPRWHTCSSSPRVRHRQSRRELAPRKSSPRPGRTSSGGRRRACRARPAWWDLPAMNAPTDVLTFPAAVPLSVYGIVSAMRPDGRRTGTGRLSWQVAGHQVATPELLGSAQDGLTPRSLAKPISGTRRRSGRRGIKATRTGGPYHQGRGLGLRPEGEQGRVTAELNGFLTTNPMRRSARSTERYAVILTTAEEWRSGSERPWSEPARYSGPCRTARSDRRPRGEAGRAASCGVRWSGEQEASARQGEWRYQHLGEIPVRS